MIITPNKKENHSNQIILSYSNKLVIHCVEIQTMEYSLQIYLSYFYYENIALSVLFLFVVILF